MPTTLKANENTCPTYFSEWMIKFINVGFTPDDISIQCTDDLKDENVNFAWSEWGRCIGEKFECDKNQKQSRLRICGHICPENIQWSESRNCQSQGFRFKAVF